MRLIHFSDTHLGFSEYYKIDPVTGINQREQDFYDAWEQVLNGILELQPDLVVHCGDLFHSPRPNNRAIRIALEGVQKISNAGIPMVIISGNHETPRIRTTGSIFESLALFPNVYAAYESRYICHIIKNVAVHCLPHCSLTEELEAGLAAIAKPAHVDGHLFLTHGAWSGGGYGMGEFNEQRLPDLEVQTGLTFDYIALGHYHKQIDVNAHISYSGSTERTSLSQSEHRCCYLEVDLATASKTVHPVQTRPMLRLPVLDAEHLSLAEIYGQAQTIAPQCPAGSIVQWGVENIQESVFLQMDMRIIEDCFQHCLHLDKQFNILIPDASRRQWSERFDALPNEFARYVNALEEPGLDKNRLIELGHHYLESWSLNE
jgi:DNA repair protein SbcD/Mre11